MEINNNNPSLFQMAKPDPALDFWLNQWTPELFIVRVALRKLLSWSEVCLLYTSDAADE